MTRRSFAEAYERAPLFASLLDRRTWRVAATTTQTAGTASKGLPSTARPSLVRSGSQAAAAMSSIAAGQRTSTHVPSTYVPLEDWKRYTASAAVVARMPSPRASQRRPGRQPVSEKTPKTAERRRTSPSG